MKEIPLSKGTVAIVDDDVYEWASQCKWSDNGNGYAVRSEWIAPKTYRKQYLHREVAGAKPGEDVDHINGNKADNRKENLRVCTRAENNRNCSGKKRKYSKYKGVSLNKSTNKWSAKITVNYKQMKLGAFTCEVDAARAYNEAAIKYFGEFANINDLSEEANQ